MIVLPRLQDQPANMAQWIGSAAGLQMKCWRACAALAVQLPYEQMRFARSILEGGQVKRLPAAETAPSEPGAFLDPATPAAPAKPKPVARKTTNKRKVSASPRKGSARKALPRKADTGKASASAAALKSAAGKPASRTVTSARSAGLPKPSAPAGAKPATSQPAVEKTAETQDVKTGVAQSQLPHPGGANSVARKPRRAPSKPPSLPDALAGSKDQKDS